MGFERAPVKQSSGNALQFIMVAVPLLLSITLNNSNYIPCLLQYQQTWYMELDSVLYIYLYPASMPPHQTKYWVVMFQHRAETVEPLGSVHIRVKFLRFPL